MREILYPFEICVILNSVFWERKFNLPGSLFIKSRQIENWAKSNLRTIEIGPWVKLLTSKASQCLVGKPLVRTFPDFRYFGFSAQKSPKMCQLRRPISQKRLNIFWFCKKFLTPHNQEYKICQNKENLKFLLNPPPYRLNPTWCGGAIMAPEVCKLPAFKIL